MPQDFIQQLLLILLGLLFFKDLIGIYLNKLLEKVFGVKVNGNGHHDIIAKLTAFEENHLHTLTEKFDEFKDEMVKHNATEIEILRDIKDIVKNK